MVTLSYRVKAQFFDRRAVTDVVDKKKRGLLSKAGAFVRQAARSSIRRRKAVSAAGSPPSAHSRDAVATIKNILFAYEPSTGGVVVGPVALNVKHSLNGSALQGGTVPNVLEFGGTLGTFEVQGRDGVWRRADLRSRRRIGGRPQRMRQARYQARPYMAPAVEREGPKFPALFKNSIVKAA
jgi:hypothetical protein